MDGQYCGDVPHPAGQTGQGLQVHCDVRRDAEERGRTPCGQLVLLGHHHRRKLHSKMGEPYYELCGQCLRCGSSIGRGYCRTRSHMHIHTHAHNKPLKDNAMLPHSQRGAPKCHTICSTYAHLVDWLSFLTLMKPNNSNTPNLGHFQHGGVTVKLVT